MHEHVSADHHKAYTGTEWSEVFFIIVAVLWLGGAATFGALVLMGGERANVTAPAVSNETPVANSAEAQ